MGFLTPLYVAGLAALALPVLLHLIRRTPRGRQVFSSLMFLHPSPPRVTRRSRLDQLLLLILRGLALALLALAFARPFWRRAADLLFEDPPGRKVAILVDASASMRRDDLWTRTLAAVRQFVDQLDAADDPALFTFDDRLRMVVDWDDEARIENTQQTALVRAQLAELQPGWGGTNLGAALMGLGDRLDQTDSEAALQVVLFTDQQRGAQTAALQGYEWPAGVYLSVHRIEPTRTTNAAPRLLSDLESDDDASRPRVRITNAANSASDQFHVAWGRGTAPLSNAPRQEATESSGTQPGVTSPTATPPTANQAGALRVAAYVPAGQTRIIRLPLPAVAASADRLVLEGDDATFDNTIYVVPEPRETVRVLYGGRDAGTDPQGLRYYLETALATSARRDVQIVSGEPGQPLPLESAPTPFQLVVLTEPLDSQTTRLLSDYLQTGGAVLAVPSDQASLATLSGIADSVGAESPDPELPTANPDAYVMFGEIDFGHSMFAPFANSRYNDFTKIHFWNHRRMSVAADSKAHVIARFDNGLPAICEQLVGTGRVIVLASTWRPADSQLALSTKFVPLLESILAGPASARPKSAGYVVNQPIALPQEGATRNGSDRVPAKRKIWKPDGTEIELADDLAAFDGADQPGIYRLSGPSRSLEFAVNLAAAESDTAPVDVDVLEQLGVKIGQQPSRAEQLARQRNERDRELESHQKLWRWLMLTVLGVLAVETWLAGRRARLAVAPSPS